MSFKYMKKLTDGSRGVSRNWTFENYKNLRITRSYRLHKSEEFKESYNFLKITENTSLKYIKKDDR